MRISFVCTLICGSTLCLAQEPAARRPIAGDAILKDFRFHSGETLPEIRMHYRTFGQPKRDSNGKVSNTVLILHGTSGDGSSLIRREFSGELFGPGQPLDVSKYFIVLPDNLGHGKSSKPSDGLRAKFPNYCYPDMIEAQRRMLVEGLKVDHLRLVIGTSMGGMHAWLWGQLHPDFTDALMPLASLPTRMSGRNRMWRKLISDTIRLDPEWQAGNYTKPPRSLKTAVGIMTLMSSNPALRQIEAPTAAKADEVFERTIAAMAARLDANDLLYAVESSADYNPEPGLSKIRAMLVAINFADDLINPPELGILERQIKLVPNGKSILIPFGPDTVGHGTHTKAVIWKRHLIDLLRASERSAPDAARK